MCTNACARTTGADEGRQAMTAAIVRGVEDATLG